MTEKPTYEELLEKIENLEKALSRAKEKDRAVIRALSEDFQRFADRSRDAIYRYDIESRTFPFFNKLFLENYGSKIDGTETLTLQSALSHIHPEDQDKVIRAIERSFQSGTNAGEIEYRHLQSDGSVKWMHDKWTIIRDENDMPSAIEGFIRDNTRRKQAEEELERSRHNALIGSYIVQDAAFRYVNPEFCRIIGYSEDELLDTHPLSYVHEEDRDLVAENAIQMLKGAANTPYEFRIIHKSGKIRWIMETITPVTHAGRRASLGYFMDITHRKSVETERREKEKLQAIIELAGSVRHELHNPLQIVLTCSEKLSLGNAPDPLMNERLRLLKRAVKRLVDLAGKFQNITRYTTKDYVQGKKIIDIDNASGG